MSLLFSHRLSALIGKELNQFRRDPKIVMSLILPPILQVLLFGFVLNSKIETLRLGVIDQSNTPQSRELIADLSRSESFRLTRSYLDPQQLGAAITDGTVQAGLIIPYDFSRSLQRGRRADVQFLLNAMDANTATIARTYAQAVLQTYAGALLSNGVHAEFSQIATRDVGRTGAVDLQPSFLFNPGLQAAWFTVTGVLGMLSILNGALVATDLMIRERERGTIEQLLMSPATTFEIILAKIAPLFLLLCLMSLNIIGIGRLVFHVPFRGSFSLVFCGCMLCVLCGIGLGTFLASVSKTEYQANLTAFFINPPLASLGGVVTPIEAMPDWLRHFAVLNPIYHFGVIGRVAMLKGGGIETLWPHFLALGAIAVTLLFFSVLRFRKQLA